MAIPAIAIGAPFARSCARGGTWRVAARFEHTLWLRGSGGALGALTTYPNPGPHRAVVADLPPWCVGVVARAGYEMLRADGATVAWTPSAEWDTRPRRFRLTASERRVASSCIANTISTVGLPDDGGFWDWLAARWDGAQTALQRRDACAIAHVAGEMIGRGPGLTPAGDDVIQGLLLALWADEDVGSGFLRAVRRLVMPYLPRTTPLGAQCIREALDGLAFGALHKLIGELPRPSDAGVSALLATGATSGTACALGVALALAR